MQRTDAIGAGHAYKDLLRLLALNGVFEVPGCPRWVADTRVNFTTDRQGGASLSSESGSVKDSLTQTRIGEAPESGEFVRGRPPPRITRMHPLCRTHGSESVYPAFPAPSPVSRARAATNALLPQSEGVDCAGVWALGCRRQTEDMREFSNMLKQMVLGGAFFAAAAFSAQAQTLIDGGQVDEILNLARGYGAATLETQSNGDPRITGKIEGVSYQVYFMNCTDNKNCEDLNFYAGFLDNKQTLEVINAWNRDKRFGKAYLDSDLDAVIEFDVNLEKGVSSGNLDAAFGIWKLILDQYTTYIGYK
jgi:hypothetical protein